MNNYIRDKMKKNMLPVSKEQPNNKAVNDSIRAAAGRGTAKSAAASAEASGEKLSGAGRAAENAAPVFPEMLNTVLTAACRSTAAPAKAVIVSADHAAALFRMEKAGTNARIAARHLLKND